jgi:hypothetical protein
MNTTRSISLAAVAAAALAVAMTGTAAANNGALVLNYGGCVASGFPDPSTGDTGPALLVINKNQFLLFAPPGLGDRTGNGCVPDAPPA